MNIRRLQGAALIISAVINLVGLLGSGTSAVRILFVIGALLLIFGVPAIESVQQAGMLDWAGIALIELAAIIALVLNISFMSGAGISSSALPLASAILGGIGRRSRARARRGRRRRGRRRLAAADAEDPEAQGQEEGADDRRDDEVDRAIPGGKRVQVNGQGPGLAVGEHKPNRNALAREETLKDTLYLGGTMNGHFVDRH